jgi:hypothetical protein
MRNPRRDISKVVVGDAKVCAFPVSKYSLWCFSNKVCSREEPILIRIHHLKSNRLVQVLYDVSIAYKTELSRNLYLESDCFNASILANELESALQMLGLDRFL